MAVINCKMCGSPLPMNPGVTVVECEYCGREQTVPSMDNEKKLTLFARAERLRTACEFDKAAGVFETIVADFPEEAEAYWGLVLCKYGIEYVDDPATSDKIPTCHRSSFDSVFDDPDYEQAYDNADVSSRKVYRAEGKRIEDVRRGIISVSANEDPYDIFICYKETAENGDRTLDSVLAQDIYDALTDKGYRVFFARITLEDKLGQEYEPYIFAALNSAKIMLAVGTEFEYYNAVWVKNEWSRFLKLMAKDKGKHLIPCFKGLDAYDMPKEFNKLQAQDLGKVGAMQDLLRGIEKLLPRQKEVTKEIVKEQVVVQQGGNSNVIALLKRGNMALEDSEWDKAEQFFEEVLNQDAECAEAYLGKAMAAAEVDSLERLIVRYQWDDKNYRRGKQFAKGALRNRINECEQKEETLQAILRKQEEEKRIAREQRVEQERLAKEKLRAERIAKEKKEAELRYDKLYRQLCEAQEYAMEIRQAWKWNALAQEFSYLNGYKDSAERSTYCKEQAVIVERAAAERRKRQMTWIDEGRCAHCGGGFIGLFTSKCASCGRPKDY